MGSTMRIVRLFWLCLLTTLFATGAFAQLQVVKLGAKLEPADTRAGESAQIIVTARVDKPWHIYGVGADGGPTNTKISLAKTNVAASNGEVIEPPSKSLKDPFGKVLAVHEGVTSFALPIKLADDLAGKQALKVNVTYQPCDDKSCLFVTDETLTVTFTPAEGATRPERTAAVTTVPVQPKGHIAPEAKPTPAEIGAGAAPQDEFAERVAKAQSSGLISYLVLAFSMGLLALLTPCVFPMIPVTVSFFSKRTGDGERKTNYSGALAYCLGIIGTFTGLGLAVSAIFGSSGIQDLSTNPWVNLGMAIIFVALALSLFGVFELALPARWTTRISKETGRQGLGGPVVMGLLFSLTSFTCTVPFVATLLAGASKGQVFYPVVGMLAFSTAFALPFFLLALFPQYLAKLPKSGSWLSTVKASMGFLELAAALKFFSSAEVVWRLGWLTKPVFLAIWSALAVVGGFYLFGWILLGSDPTPGKIGWGRRTFGLAMVACGVWCLAAIEGASLGKLTSFLPPDPYPGKAASGNQAVLWGHDYKAALAQAKKDNRNVFVNFTGYTCVNCRYMEQVMFVKPAIANAINTYIPVELYTDGGTEEDRQNQLLRERLTKVPSNPAYVIITPDEKVLRIMQGLEDNESRVLAFFEPE